MRVLLAGATGTIGQATLRALLAAGHHVLCPIRAETSRLAPGAQGLICDLLRPGDLTRALAGQPIDAVVSCMATRSGAPADAWAVEHRAPRALMEQARDAGATRFVLLSAICVQKPQLAFQQAKLAFEADLTQSGMDWTIIRPTAFFKSLSGQVARVQSGKPFLLFGDGRLTACKPISDRDLAAYILAALTDPATHGRILPIGGPGPAITPRDQATYLFDRLGKPPRLRHVPLALMDGIVGTLSLLSRVSPRFRDRAEFARTGRYYATQSMLVWNPQTENYDAKATPEYGSDTLWDHYDALLDGRAKIDLGAHAIFD